MVSKNKKLSSAVEIFEQSVEGSIRKISLSDIMPSVEQPRKNIEVNLKSLISSLKSEGLLQPIVVTKEGSDYKIIAGERRYRAAKAAGWKDIECRILSKNEKDTFRLAVIENLQRENLDPIEEANAYRKLKDRYNYNDKEMSDIIGKSRNYISEILSIADIPDDLQEKATNTGLDSKNILVQYAQAVKNGFGDQFLTEFKNGTITTVREAKGFVKDSKAPTSKQTRPPKPKNQTEISIQTDRINSNTLKISITAKNLKANIEKIEDLIRKILSRA